MALALAAFPLLPAAAAAIPLSVGMSSQVQMGWQSSLRQANRLQRVQEIGTGGQHIRPIDGSGSFALTGTLFEADPSQETFDYTATNRDISIITNSSTSSFSVLSTTTTTGQVSSPEPLGFFSTGSRAF
jgi:hypothetical protein